MARREPLGVWLYGVLVAELTSTRPGEVRCRYSTEALATWPLNTPLLSCSLPLRADRQQAGLFFRGLLPEGRHLQALAAQANVATYDTLGLLARYGKDVAGAAVIAAEEPVAQVARVEAYSSAGLEEEVASLPDRPLGIHDDSDLSLAGLQDKLLLVDLGNGSWGRPVHGYPSTHILKVEDRRYPGMAEMEAACLGLAKAVGLTTVDATVQVIAAVPCLIVSRFDRSRGQTGQVARLHQEDACQALARDHEAAQGHGKYERAGGPSLLDVAGVLDRFGTDPVAELERLAQVVTFTVAIGNADAHGKNLGFVHTAPGSVSLAPLYDTVPTALWPNLRKTAAMMVNGQRDLGCVALEDIIAETGRWRLERERAERSSARTAEALRDAARALPLPEELKVAVAGHCERLLHGR
jgi:serine/threonine-protein kinase HipA